MPVKTVALQVVAITDAANRQIAATGAYFEKLRQANPVELKVKLDRAQAIAESKILAKEMAQTIRDTVKLDADRSGIGGIPFLGRLFRGGTGPGEGLPGVLGKIGGIGPVPPIGALPPAATIGALAAGLAALPFLAQAAAGGITLALGGGLAALGVAGALGTGKSVTPAMITAAHDALRAAQLRQAAAQDKLNQLMAAGTTNAGKLASAQAAVASSSGSVVNAQARLNALLNDAQTPGQLAMRRAFQNLSNDAQTSLAKIGRSFQPVLLSIFQTADSVLTKLTPVLTASVAAIAGPVKLIGDTLLKAFASPQVVTAIKTLGTAFGGLLKAFAPSIPGIVTSIADGFTNLFRAVARNPKAFADMATGLFHLIGILVDVLAWLTNVADYVEHHWKPVLTGAVGPILDHWHGLADFFTKTLPDAFRSVVIVALRTADGIAGAFGHLPGFLGAPFRAAKAAIDRELGLIDGSVAQHVQNIKTQWALLNGITATLNLNVVQHGVNPGPGSTNPNPFTRRFASGTSSAAPGWAWVGEQGAELVRFGGGEQVIPAGIARGYASGAGYGGGSGTKAIEDRLDILIGAIGTLTGVTAQAPAVLGAALAGGARSAQYGALYP